MYHRRSLLAPIMTRAERTRVEIKVITDRIMRRTRGTLTRAQAREIAKRMQYTGCGGNDYIGFRRAGETLKRGPLLELSAEHHCAVLFNACGPVSGMWPEDYVALEARFAAEDAAAAFRAQILEIVAGSSERRAA